MDKNEFCKWNGSYVTDAMWDIIEYKMNTYPQGRGQFMLDYKELEESIAKECDEYQKKLKKKLADLDYSKYVTEVKFDRAEKEVDDILRAKQKISLENIKLKKQLDENSEYVKKAQYNAQVYAQKLRKAEIDVENMKVRIEFLEDKLETYKTILQDLIDD